VDGEGHDPVLTGTGSTASGPPSARRAAAASLGDVLGNRDIRWLELAWTIGVGAAAADAIVESRLHGDT
jgi:hypothetical protein